MKKIILALTLVFAFMLALTANSFAQEKDNHTASEEAKGKEVFDKLQSKQMNCKNLTEDDFEVLGEYYMGQMSGATHETMNEMMVQMMGEGGEEQMHVVMGKRLSGCDSSTSMPSNMMSGMMSMMIGSAGPSATSSGLSGSSQLGGNSLVGSWGGLLFGIYSIIFSVLILIILVLLAIWLWQQIQKK